MESKNSHKEKYRATNAKHWCEYCKLFVMNNEPSRKRHETSSQHKDSVKRFVERVQREDEKQVRLLKQFAGKTGVALGADTAKSTKPETTASFYKGPAKTYGAQSTAVPVPLLSVKPPVPRSVALKSAAPPPEDDKKAKEKLMAQVAVVGQWEPVTEPTCESRVTETESVDRVHPVQSSKRLKTELDPNYETDFVVTEKILPSAHTDKAEEEVQVEFKQRSSNVNRRNIRK